MKVLAICVGALILGGCATTHNWFYNPDGTVCAESRSAVVGTGETELIIINPCGSSAYTTRDTGISDNGKDAIGKVAEGLAKGAVKGVVPTP